MQQHSLLATKLYIPPIRPELVSRSRLAERLKEGMTRGLTVISAPAGFGKTTLVSEWVNRLRSDAAHEGQSAHRVAWPSLDEGDNDPTRFLVYTIAALRTTEANIGKGVLSALQSCHPPPTEAVLISLINEIAATPDRIMFVLDDYHLLDADPIHDAFTFHFSTCRHRCTHYSVNHGLICENNGVILSLKEMGMAKR
jgi:LuxR family maltose regulon positive regulatory protein